MKFLQIILFLINIIFAAALCGVYASAFISPEITPIPNLMGLAFPILVVINLLFVLWWLITKPKRMILSVIVIILGFLPLSKTYRFSNKPLPADDKESMHLLSYNVQLFGLYNWKNNLSIRDSIIDFIHNENPDILCIQEYYKNSLGNFETKGEILKKLDNMQVHEAFSTSLYESQYFGVATFMKYPIINTGEIQFDSTHNMAQYTDFIFQADTLRLYNIHLQSIYFDDENYQEVDKFTSTDFDKAKLIRIKSLTKKIAYASQRRALQAETIHNHIKKSPYPVIVCGDFNAPVTSYEYASVAKGLKDAFQSAGKGFGFSFQRSLVSMRIDHILHSKSLKSYQFNTKNLTHSDHFPVSCYIRKK